jgi:hypothetical protein
VLLLLLLLRLLRLLLLLLLLWCEISQHQRAHAQPTEQHAGWEQGQGSATGCQDLQVALARTSAAAI